MKFEPILSWWFLAVLFAPLAIWLVYDVLRNILRKKRPFHGRVYWRFVGLLSCLVVIAIGPSIPGARAQAGVINLDVIIAIDRTTSISAEDYDGQHPRLEGVKHDVLQLVERVKGARIALVTFDSSARINVPFTNDTSAVTMAIKVLDQEVSTYSKGSTIDLPIETIERLLNQSKAAHPERGRLVFYIGDGEQTDAASTPKSFASLQPLLNGGAVLGYGTTTGGRMKYYYGYQGYGWDDTATEYIKDYSTYSSSGFSDAVSVINESNLRTIADDLGVTYLHRTSLDQSLDEVVDASKLKVVGDTHREVVGYTSLYWIAATVLAALLLWWLVDLWTPIRQGLKKGVA